ncbi:phosphoglucomutase 3-like protein nst [Megalopta genalis]|uniref:phosphoglucomutase 3-like protein nst n=1 Tax=Megalopta genalis TaxID=115081 RepID=UPI00144327C5|nr:phosphoacetylglucosamine mutase [Megalopta genalis]XP_033324475.1 phosphoacetylglucosamine mutase [Megalopta genalis]XP_033324476.1 phosphoacetylglucosamine mutase [Megalopta genalis]XP_033324477.1 phosphoacetylglucosamine mutase [Megalopta genalis]
MEFSQLESIFNENYNKKYSNYIQYGTAGFRTTAHLLEHVLYRMGILAVLRSKMKNAAIGLMITASHNIGSDNGVKLVDPAGEMLEASWELIATNLANVEDSKLVSNVEQIIREQNINMSATATVIVGRDTRESGPVLFNAAIAGIQALNGTIKDFGVITTPQLHYLVVCTNNNKYGNATLHGYYEKISKSFKHIRQDKMNNGHYVAELSLDAANGVGAMAGKKFQEYLGTSLIINLYNDGNGELNHMCGADYIKVKQVPPTNFSVETNVRCVSIDGDADRVIYFYVDENNKFHLLDGDRIATLIAGYFKELLQELNSFIDLFHLGLVQTAYANGGSTNYISNILQIPVVCAPTGVKHLHNEALKFEIGVYFEANGHGTVLFKDIVIETLKNATTNPNLTASQTAAASTLLNIIDVINQSVGDAFSDMLLVETILHAKGWSIIDWEKSYKDLPNKQLLIKVNDKNVITTTDAERRCVSPKGLQDEIDRVVLQYSKGRSFVRPSGTENVVRVYAECEDPNDLNKFITAVALLVHRHAGGVGPEPQLS